jgi:polysaccharide biosynthesis protein PslH
MRVLFLTHRLPYAPNRGDRIRAFHIIRSLAGTVELEVMSLVHDRDELAHVEQVRAMGAEVTAFQVPRLRNHAAAAVALSGTRPLTHVLLDAPSIGPAIRHAVATRRPDVVLAYCSGMARFALEPPLAGIPLVLDLVDVDSQKWAALSATASWPKRLIYAREARYLSGFERAAAERAHTTLVVNERERKALCDLAPRANVRIVSNGVDVQPLQPHTAAADVPHVVFCGVMDYQPNVDAVTWFALNVWPLVRARKPSARFIIVGSSPTAAVRRLAARDTGIDVTGTVPDVGAYLRHASIAVAPLMTARGIQNKVIEALGTGLPTVVTPQVFEGLPREARAGCRVADSVETFADQTLALLALTSAERRSLAAKADLARLGWECQLVPLHEALAEAAGVSRPLARSASC